MELEFHYLVHNTLSKAMLIQPASYPIYFVCFHIKIYPLIFLLNIFVQNFVCASHFPHECYISPPFIILDFINQLVSAVVDKLLISLLSRFCNFLYLRSSEPSSQTSSIYGDIILLCCNAVRTRRQITAFQRNTPSPYFAVRMSEYGVTSQKNNIAIFTAATTTTTIITN